MLNEKLFSEAIVNKTLKTYKTLKVYVNKFETNFCFINLAEVP